MTSDLSNIFVVKVQSLGLIDQRLGLWVFRKNLPANTIEVAKPLALETHDMKDMYSWEPEPVLALRKDEAQVLMDSLWDTGIRPTDGSGSAGAMLATQNHLKDMQKLVFK